MLLNRLTIKTKLFTAIGLAVGLTLSALGVALSGMSAISEHFTHFIEHDLAKLDAIDTMYGDGLLSGIATRNKVFVPALKPPAKVTRDAIARFDAALEHAKALNADSPENLSKLQIVENMWEENKALKRQVINTLEAGDVEGARKLLVEREHTTWRPIRKALQALRAEEEQTFESTKGRAIHEARATLATGTTLGIVAVVAGGTLVALVVLGITRSLNATIRALNDIAEGEGDLTCRLEASGKDELAKLSSAFNSFVAKIQQLIRQVAGATGELGAAASRMGAVTEETQRGVERQQSETDQVASAMNEMAATVQEVARHAADAAGAAHNADQEAKTGSQIVQDTVEAINTLAAEVGQASGVIHGLEEDSENIGTVLDVIRGIAEQTNLLALNAAIEAARAGNQGRGFAVVADEVRTLAQRTQQSTQEIQAMIERLQDGARNAVQAMERSHGRAQHSVELAAKAGGSLEVITTAVESINDMNTRIASAAEEQSAVAEEINCNLITITQVAEQNAEGAQQTASAGDDLGRLADGLAQLVGRFKV